MAISFREHDGPAKPESRLTFTIAYNEMIPRPKIDAGNIVFLSLVYGLGLPETNITDSAGGVYTKAKDGCWYTMATAQTQDAALTIGPIAGNLEIQVAVATSSRAMREAEKC